jgi:hypothetical protein
VEYVCKVHPWLYICNNNPMVGTINNFNKLGVRFSTILANINNFFFSLARFFVTYFVPNIGHRYNITFLFKLYMNNIVKGTYFWFYLF